MTLKLMAWLLTLRDNPRAHRPRGIVGYAAMQAGLTQWRWVDRSTRARVTPPLIPHPAGWHARHTIDGEELTEAGWRALELALLDGESGALRDRPAHRGTAVEHKAMSEVKT